MALVVFIVLSFFLQGALGEILCDNLPVGLCSFSISSFGNRCSLETFSSKDESRTLECKTSKVVVHNLPEWIESDECVGACGLDRNSIGISSDSLVETEFISKLCSPWCYQNCPNIIDLYYNLALGEGVYLQNLCKAQRSSTRRAMAQIMSSGAAVGPVSAVSPAPIAAGPVSARALTPGASDEPSSPVDCAPTPM